MFAKDSDKNVGLNTIIGKGTTFKGDLIVAGNARIDGTIEGSVKVSGLLSIGDSGKITANVEAKNSVVGGNIQGNILVTEKLELEPNSSISGDIKTKVLIIHGGARFDGNCQMQEQRVNAGTGFKK